MIVSPQSERALKDAGATIERLGDEMYRRPVLGIACGQRRSVGFQARMARQQRGVNIERAAGIVAGEAWREDAHKARQHQHRRRVGIDGLSQCRIKRLATGIGGMWHHMCGDACLLGAQQTRRIGAVADDRGNPRRDVCSRAVLNQRLQIAALTGNEDDEIFHRARACEEIVASKPKRKELGVQQAQRTEVREHCEHRMTAFGLNGTDIESVPILAQRIGLRSRLIHKLSNKADILLALDDLAHDKSFQLAVLE